MVVSLVSVDLWLRTCNETQPEHLLEHVADECGHDELYHLTGVQ